MQIGNYSSTRKYKTREAPEPSLNEAPQWRHVCDITTIRTTSQKTTPSGKAATVPSATRKINSFLAQA